MNTEELKLGIIDVISKSNDGLTLQEIMLQADAIINKCNVESDDINLNVDMAIFSFEKKPTCSLEERLAIIDGMLLYSHTWGRNGEARNAISLDMQLSMTMNTIQEQNKDKDFIFVGDYLYSSEGKAMVMGADFAAHFYEQRKQKIN